MTVWALFRRFLRLYSPFAKRRYRKCLANIVRLERELWPVGFSDDPFEMSFGPGTVWQVPSANYVQVLQMRKSFERQLLYGSQRPQEAS